MRHFIILFLFQLLILAVSVSSAATPTRHTFASFSFSMGYGRPQDAKHDLSATQIALGVLYNRHDFRLAYTSLSWVEAGPSTSGDKPTGGGGASEVALLYGWRVVNGRHGYICPAAGVAFARVHRRVDIVPYRDYNGDIHDHINRPYDRVGLPLNLQAVWKLSRHFGFGGEWYADINSKNTFRGLVFGLYWDKL